jgi:hypothetical protein
VGSGTALTIQFSRSPNRDALKKIIELLRLAMVSGPRRALVSRLVGHEPTERPPVQRALQRFAASKIGTTEAELERRIRRERTAQLSRGRLEAMAQAMAMASDDENADWRSMLE